MYVYMSDRSIVIISNNASGNHPRLQFRINDNYIVQIYVSMIHYPVIYGINLTPQDSRVCECVLSYYAGDIL